MSLDALCDLLARHRYYYSSETVLQNGIETVLKQNGIPYVRERAESDEERPDFIVDPGIAVEVKIKGGTSALIRQLFRYAKLRNVESIVVVASRSRLADIPEEIGGKPVRVVSLASCAFA